MQARTGRPKARAVHAEWSQAIATRQREIDTVIAAAADIGFLYDRPYVDTSRVRVAGPFTVEVFSPSGHTARQFQRQSGRERFGRGSAGERLRADRHRVS